MNLKTEPVRVVALVAGILGAVGTCLVSLGAGASALGAIGTAVITLGTVLGGGEVARSKVTPAP